MASNPHGACRVVSGPALGRQGVVWANRGVGVIVIVGVAEACLHCAAVVE